MLAATACHDRHWPRRSRSRASACAGAPGTAFQPFCRSGQTGHEMPSASLFPSLSSRYPTQPATFPEYCEAAAEWDGLSRRCGRHARNSAHIRDGQRGDCHALHHGERADASIQATDLLRVQPVPIKARRTRRGGRATVSAVDANLGLSYRCKT
jgi:hypothetical protein